MKICESINYKFVVDAGFVDVDEETCAHEAAAAAAEAEVENDANVKATEVAAVHVSVG